MLPRGGETVIAVEQERSPACRRRAGISLCVVLLLALVALPGRTLAARAQRGPSLSGQAVAALDAAAQAERDGRNAEAEAAYRTLASSPDAATAAAGNLGLGRLLVRQGRTAEAEAPLQAAIMTLGTSPDGLAATFLLGEAQADQQQNDAAATSFQTYLANNGPAAGYAALEEGWALQAATRNDDALAALAPALRATSLPIRRAALTAASVSLERQGNLTQAADDERAVAATDPPAGEQAQALLEAGRLYAAAGDTRSAAEELLAVVQEYPRLNAASTALDRLDTLGISVDPLQRATVLLDLHQNAEAETLLRRLLSATPPASVAARLTYDLAVIADRRNQNDAALTGYATAFTLDPSGATAPLAAWNRAQLLQSLGRYSDAESDYQLLARFPNDPHAAAAAFNAGLMAYEAGRSDEASRLWTAAATSSQAADAAHADLWLGKLALEHGDTAGATAALSQARAIQPAGYFGLRAEAVGQPGPDLARVSSLTLGGAPDWSVVDTWLSGWAGAEDASQFTALQATQDWREGIALSRLGWKRTPLTLIGRVLAGASQQPWGLYRAAQALDSAGLTTLALQAADELIARAPGGRMGAPLPLLRLAYPADFPDLVNADAAASGLDPLLLYAVVRQESEFNPVAGSGAGAQGLAQLIPTTAQDVAGQLGLSISTADLTRPVINLQLGAAYLAAQVKATGGDLSRAIAAYNAGAGSVARWHKQSGDDPDRFYETVDYSETRAYIRLVSENYAMYRFLYGGATHPTLLGQ